MKRKNRLPLMCPNFEVHDVASGAQQRVSHVNIATADNVLDPLCVVQIRKDRVFYSGRDKVLRSRRVPQLDDPHTYPYGFLVDRPEHASTDDTSIVIGSSNKFQVIPSGVPNGEAPRQVTIRRPPGAALYTLHRWVCTEHKWFARLLSNPVVGFPTHIEVFDLDTGDLLHKTRCPNRESKRASGVRQAEDFYWNDKRTQGVINYLGYVHQFKVSREEVRVYKACACGTLLGGTFAHVIVLEDEDRVVCYPYQDSDTPVEPLGSWSLRALTKMEPQVLRESTIRINSHLMIIFQAQEHNASQDSNVLRVVHF